jgi:hypothetical protein
VAPWVLCPSEYCEDTEEAGHVVTRDDVHGYPAPMPNLSYIVVAAALFAGVYQEPTTEAVVSSESRLVQLEHLSSNQRRTAMVAHPVGQWLEFDGQTFALQLDGSRLRVATRAGEDPDRSLERASTLRLGWLHDGERRERDLLFEPGPEGWRYGVPGVHLFNLGDESLCLIDANLDGDLDLLHDAWSARPGAPSLPLTEVLVLGDQRFRIENLTPDAQHIEGRLVPLEGSVAQRAALRRLNHLRRADGLGAVEHEPELSAGCTAHATYLEAQGWQGGGNPHEQDPRGDGASREGRAAARGAQILTSSPEEAIDALWATLPGRLLLADPDLIAAGISQDDLPIAVLDLSSRSTHKSLGRKAWNSPLLSPADGSFGQPRRYGDTPLPLPMEGAERMGPPLVLWVRGGAADVEQYSGKLYKLSGQTRRPLAVTELEVAPALGKVRGVLPTRPLARATRYVIVHRLHLDGEPRTIEARFETL